MIVRIVIMISNQQSVCDLHGHGGGVQHYDHEHYLYSKHDHFDAHEDDHQWAFDITIALATNEIQMKNVAVFIVNFKKKLL